MAGAVSDGGASLDRFVEAQEAGGTYRQALAELRGGAKRGHWMWFVFPQLAGLGRSPTARHFALADAAEARAYLGHPVLGPRLADCSRAMLAWAGEREAQAILGPVDATKFRSSMTLFEAVAPRDQGAEFAAAVEGFFGGRRDPLTLDLLGRA